MVETILKLLALILPWARDLLSRRRATEHFDMIEANAKLQGVMRKLRLETGAVRVLLLRSTNGGGIPDVGSSAWVEVVRESLSDDEDDSLLDFKGPADEVYCELLRSISKAKVVELDTETLAHSRLRTKYLADRIVKSYVFLVAIKPKVATYYVSVNLRSDGLERIEEVVRRAHIDDEIETVKDFFRDPNSHYYTKQ